MLSWRYRIRRFFGQATILQRMNTPQAWVIAAWHWHWSYTWRWSLRFSHQYPETRWGVCFWRTYCGSGFHLDLNFGRLGRVSFVVQPNSPRHYER